MTEKELRNEICKRMINIISFSGGKDSTAMLLMMIERKEPIHSVVWFDTERDFPEILKHIEKLKNNFPEIKFVTIRHWVGFDFLEQRYGGAHKSGGWCTAAKRDCCNKYVRFIIKDNPDKIVNECIGFASDEETREAKYGKKWNIRYPLQEYGITEVEALEYCYSKGYDFGGIYDWMPSKRVSCFDCPKQSKGDWCAIRKYHPELLERVGK